MQMRGMSLVDVLVGTALALVIFLGFFSLLRTSLIVSTVAKAKAGANAVAFAQMEYIRSLPYNAVGTIGGIPSGVVSQYSTSTYNGIDFPVRTFISYEDDAKDGLDTLDSNGITTDYKTVKVAVEYPVQGTIQELSTVSTIAPLGIESTVGGGTIQISVVDALGAPVSGASVQIINNITNPTVDVTTFSNIDGIVSLPGAATSTAYEVYVTKSAYSSAQTYERDATNQNPTPGYVTVTEGATSVGSFAIDLLATLTLNFFSASEEETWSDTFVDLSLLETLSQTTVSGGDMILLDSGAGYALSGSALSTTTEPSNLSSWEEINASINTPLGTTAVIQVKDASGMLIPDAVLPQNSVGFSTFPIDISAIATTTYPVLALFAVLETPDIAVTPQVQEWSISYERGPSPLSEVPFTLTGDKTIGSTGAGAALYKTITSTESEEDGTKTLLLEWDVYQFTLGGGYTLESSSIETPFQLLPNTNTSVDVFVTSP